MNRLLLSFILVIISASAFAQMKIHDNGKAVFALDPGITPKGQVHVQSNLNDAAQTLYLDGPKSATAFTETFASLYLGNSQNTNFNYARLNFGDGDAAATASIGGRILDHLGNSGTLEFWTRQTGQPIKQRMTIYDNGDVNIGGGPVDYMFSVNGDASKIGGGTWKVPSDVRLKTLITPFTDGLNQILKMKPVSFHYNGKGGISDTETEFVGVIAQEMQEIAPYTITSSGSDDYLEFDSNAVIYMLINAVKEQQAQIQKLEKIIARQID